MFVRHGASRCAGVRGLAVVNGAASSWRLLAPPSHPHPSIVAPLGRRRPVVKPPREIGTGTGSSNRPPPAPQPPSSATPKQERDQAASLRRRIRDHGTTVPPRTLSVVLGEDRWGGREDGGTAEESASYGGVAGGDGCGGASWRMEDATGRLLATPLGGFSPPRVREVNRMIEHWTARRTFEGAVRAEELLYRLFDEADHAAVAAAGSSPAGRVDVGDDDAAKKFFDPHGKPLLSAVIDVWRIVGGVEAAERAERLLLFARDRFETTGGGFPAPSVKDYNEVLDAWSNCCGECDEAPDRAEALLDRMEEGIRGGRYSSVPLTVKPDTVSYNTVISAWAHAGGHGRRGAARRAEVILRRMEADDDPNVAPNTVSYSAVIDAWAKSEDESDSAVRAERLLDKMQEEYHRGNVLVKPNAITYGSVIDAWSRSSHPEAADRAEGVLMRMEGLRDRYNRAEFIDGVDSIGPSSDVVVRPNTICYNTVINAWSRRGEARRAEAVLRRLIELSSSGSDDPDHDRPRPNTVSFNACIHAWARSGEKDAARRAEELLTYMEREVESGTGNPDVSPDTISFSAVIDALSKSGERGSARRAEDVLRRMQELSDSGNESVKPNVVTFGAVIDAWSRDGGGGGDGRSRRRGFTSESSAQRAESILLDMQERYEAGVSDVRPNDVVFNAVLNAWSRCGTGSSARRAEALLRRMRDLHDSGRNDDAMPDRIGYNACITAWSRSGEDDSAERAESLLNEMRRLNEEGKVSLDPDTISFNAVINAWARSRRKDRAHRAEDLLRQMRDLCDSGKEYVKPDTITYNACINAWSKSGDEDAARRATALLRRMQDEYNAGNLDVRPDEISFNSVINAWARSDSPRKASEAVSLLRQMQDMSKDGKLNIRPTVVSFNSVLNACATSKGGGVERDCLHHAVGLMDEMANSITVDPDHVTYSTLLKALSNLMPGGESRDVLAEGIFRRCCAAGQVSPSVLSSLRIASPSVYANAVVGVSPDRRRVSMADIPSEWRQNVPDIVRASGRSRQTQKVLRNEEF